MLLTAKATEGVAPSTGETEGSIRAGPSTGVTMEALQERTARLEARVQEDAAVVRVAQLSVAEVAGQLKVQDRACSTESWSLDNLFYHAAAWLYSMCCNHPFYSIHNIHSTLVPLSHPSLSTLLPPLILTTVTHNGAITRKRTEKLDVLVARRPDPYVLPVSEAIFPPSLPPSLPLLTCHHRKSA